MTLGTLQGGCKILIADDHRISTRHAQAALENPRTQIRTAHSATETLSLSALWLPHIICIDLHLDGHEGTDVIKKIRSEWPESQPEPRIIVITGDRGGLSTKVMESLKIEKVLVKPVSGKQLRLYTGLSDLDKPESAHETMPEMQMRNLFLEELGQRLPELDQSVAQLQLVETTAILHQLIASAAICGESGFAADLRLLNARCRKNGALDEIAFAYRAVLESAQKLILQTADAQP